VTVSPPPRPDVGQLSGPPLPELPERAGPFPPPATWRWWEAIAVYFGGMVIGSVVVSPLLNLGDIQGRDGGATGLGIAISLLSEVVVLGVLVVWLQLRHPRWREAVRFPPRGAALREAGAGVAAGLLLYPVVTIGVGSIVVYVFDLVSKSTVEAPNQLTSGLSSEGVALAVTYGLIVAPVVEEFFFRGILFRSIRDRRGFWPAAFGSAVVFGIVHWVPAPTRDAFILPIVMTFTGLGLAYVYERRGNLVANIATHVTFNVIGLVSVIGLSGVLRLG
jgi:membrane protease YdiL (CAAX protease family)